MDFSVLRRHGTTLFALTVALTAGSQSLMATGNLLKATPSSATLTCNTASTPPVTQIVIAPVAALTGQNTLAVTFAAAPTGVVVTPSSGTLSAGTSLTFNVSAAPNCTGVTAGSVTLQFQQGGGNTNDISVPLTIAAPVTTTSALVATPSSVSISCLNTGGNNYTYYGQTVSVTSPVSGGTPFTVTTASGGNLPSWLAAIAGGTASSPPATFTVIGTGSSCGGATNSVPATTSLHLVTTDGGLGVPDVKIPVTLNLVTASPLSWCLTGVGCSPPPTLASLNYTKGSGTPGKVTVTVLSSAAAYFSMDTSTLPTWLTADSTSGSIAASGSKTITFTTTSVADTLVPGTYSAGNGIRLNVNGYAPIFIPVSLQLSNTPSKISVSEGQTRNYNWVIGTQLPTPVVTAVSTDTPVSFTVSTAGPLFAGGSTSITQGLAYSFGTPIGVNFSQSAFAAASPGNVLTGTVTLTSGTPATNLVVTFNVTVQAAAATLSTVSPASLPTATTGTKFQGMVLTGSGFVYSNNPALQTVVGIVPANSNTISVDTNIAVTGGDSSHIDFTITANTSDLLIPFTTGGTVTIGVCTPVNGTCSTPTGTATLTIGSNPIISAVTSSSTFVQSSPTTVAPFDMISIWGSNFCTSGGSGCSSSQVVYGNPDPMYLTYPTALNVDATLGSPALSASTPCTGTQRCVTVSFYAHSSVPPAGFIANAPLLFATTGQINLVVPSTVGTTGTVDMYVNFGYGAAGSATQHSSAVYTVTLAPKDPGIFTVGADGQGSGAILSYPSYALVNSSNPAGLRGSAADSDMIQIYMTGLGIPDSTGSGSGGVSAWSSDCYSPTAYLSLFNALTSPAVSLTSLDGAIITPNANATGRLVPCFLSTDTLSVTVGGAAASFVPAGSYAGFANGTVAGLYQINVYLPTSATALTTISNSNAAVLTGPAQVPVKVTSTVSAVNYSSQNGVYVWVSPKLKVQPPSVLTGTVDVAYSQSVVASESPSVSTITYAVTSGALPNGLTLNTSSGLISGTPQANSGGSYIVTVTASDSANTPVTGSTTFTLVIAGALFMTSNHAGPFTTTFGTPVGTPPTITATGGAYPYTFTLTANAGPAPTGMTVSNSGVFATTALTPAGVYAVIVTATDSNGLTGTFSFTVTVNLNVSYTNPTPLATGTLTNLTTTGYTTAPTYTITSYTNALGTTYTGASAATHASTDGITVSGSAVATSSLASGTYSITVTATDNSAPGGGATGTTGSITFTL
jgi:hypothetical protein